MSKISKMSKFRKWFVISVIACVALATAVMVTRMAMDYGDFYSHAEFTEFFACSGPESGTGLPQKPVSDVAPGTRTVYVCGYLEADSRIPLYLLLFHDNKATKWFDPEEYYQKGYFYKEIPRIWRQKPGSYRVEVRLGRRILASTEFVVEP